MNNKDNNQKSTLNIIRKINMIRTSEEKMTFKDSAHYLWSFIALGINWMIYKRFLFVLLISLVLVGALVWSPHLGIILCILTPILLGIYGKFLYFKIITKSYENHDSKEHKMLLPISLVIAWMMIIIAGVILLNEVLDVLLLK
ncbi:MAG: hypothetical protein ACRC92_15590 [Peptostreptococcaceae bacterium]